MAAVTIPEDVADALVRGPGPVTAVDWHEEVGSTNAVATHAAARGAPTGLLVLADTQTAGRGRHARRWHAPPGTSLLCSLLLRPGRTLQEWPVLGLAAGVAVARTAARWTSDVALKWPNDLLLGGLKAAGILVEASADAVVVGIGLNVDWRGLPRPVPLTSLAEVAGTPVDRWDVLADLVGHVGAEVDTWSADPPASVARYRRWCATLGRRVRVAGTTPVVGTAATVNAAGALVVHPDHGPPVTVTAGDVEHLREEAR